MFRRVNVSNIEYSTMLAHMFTSSSKDLSLSLSHHVVFDSASIVLGGSAGGPSEVAHVGVGEVVAVRGSAAVAHDRPVPDNNRNSNGVRTAMAHSNGAIVGKRRVGRMPGTVDRAAQQSRQGGGEGKGLPQFLLPSMGPTDDEGVPLFQRVSKPDGTFCWCGGAYREQDKNKEQRNERNRRTKP